MKLGIIGLGEGRSSMSAALSSDKLELHRICDLNEDLCRKRASEFDFHHYTTRYEDLLED
jgi:predicted dehydrogenase